MDQMNEATHCHPPSQKKKGEKKMNQNQIKRRNGNTDSQKKKLDE